MNPFSIILLALFFSLSAAAQTREKTPADIDYYNSMAYRCHEKGDVAAAAKNFLRYLQEPTLRGMTAAQQDSLYKADANVYDHAAVNAMYLFYSVGDMDGVLETLPYGRRIDKPMYNVYITSMEACKEKGLDSLWVALAQEAVMRCPENTQFLDQLVDYYQAKGDTKAAYEELDKLIAKDSQDADAWYLKGVIYFNVDNNVSAARNCFAKALAINYSHAQASAAMGTTYIRDIVECRRKGMFKLVFTAAGEQVKQTSYRKELAEVQPYYYNACKFLETARRMRPDDYALWGNQLLECYKFLNQKEKYEALQKELTE